MPGQGLLRPWWHRQMETFSALLALCEGKPHVTGEFSRKGQWRGALIFSLIFAWTNGWVNNRDAGDLRRHRAHYDTPVIPILYFVAMDIHFADMNTILEITIRFPRVIYEKRAKFNIWTVDNQGPWRISVSLDTPKQTAVEVGYG